MNAVDEQALAEFYVSDLMDWRAAFKRAGFKRDTKDETSMVLHCLMARAYTTDLARNITHLKVKITCVDEHPNSEGGLTLAMAVSIGYELEAPTSTKAGTFRRARGETPQCFVRLLSTDRALRRLKKTVVQFTQFIQKFEFFDSTSFCEWLVRVMAPAAGGDAFDDLERYFEIAKSDKLEQEQERANRATRGKRMLRATVPEPQPVKLYRKIGRDKKFRRLFPDA